MNADITEEQLPTPPSITIDDIANAVQIIDYAAEQGAFRGWKTIEQVLIVRNRLKSFLEAAEVQKQAATEAATEETQK